ncbi:MAG TPA: fimbrial protein [Luteibacter sp.]|jgi:type 1 fimbria pilin|nr:fimbrial protein [Luteibacter sp.]
MREIKMKHCKRWRARSALLATLALAGWLQEAHACAPDAQLPALDFGEMVYGTAQGSVVNELVPMSEWVEISGDKVFTDCTLSGEHSVAWIYSDRSVVGTYLEDGESYPALRVPSVGGGSAKLAIVFKRSYNDGPMKPIKFDGADYESVVPASMRFRIMARILIQAPITYGRGSLSYSYHLAVIRGGFHGKSHPGRVAGNFELRANTCALISDETLYVTLDPVAASEFEGMGGKVGGREIDLRLRCDPDVRVHATMTDATSPANRTSTLSLADGSTAMGVGFEILRNGNVPVFFGPDSSVIGAENQFHVADIPASGGEVVLPLTVRYVQTEPVLIPGELYARATITFSYQ